jgi:isocitrate dehydrogenase kinase/phosphatase
MEQHRDLYTADWWLEVQKRVAARELIDIFPYEERLTASTRSPI